MTVSGKDYLECRIFYFKFLHQGNALKSSSSICVQNMMENIVLTPYSDKSYLVAN